MVTQAVEMTVKLMLANTRRPMQVCSEKTVLMIGRAVTGVRRTATCALQDPTTARQGLLTGRESPMAMRQRFGAGARDAKGAESSVRTPRGLLSSVVRGAVCAILLGTSAGNATAQNIIDSTHGAGAGSFELGGPFIPTGFDFMRLQTGFTTITGWTVGGPSGVDWLRNSGHRAAGGSKSLDLKGTVAGAFGEISTTIPTDSGCVYMLRFKAYGGGISMSNSGLVSAASLINAPFQPPGQSPPVAVYQDYQFAFTALATTTTIRFRSDVSSDSFGPIIDDVIVTVLGCNPVVVTQPSSGSACPADSAVFTVSVAGSGPFNYQWQWQPAGPSTPWAALSNGINLSTQAIPAFDVTGATTAAVGVRSIGGLGGNFRCIVTNSWGSVTSTEATLTIIACTCGLADVASDSLDTDRNPNNAIGPEDLDAFIAGFIADNTAIADVASDSLDTAYSPNGSVGPEDLDAFIASFIAGC